MATYPKIADNEMNYFQFKARQILLLRKEDTEWRDFCKNVAPDCATCLSENITSKVFKEVGIQTQTKPSAEKLVKPNLQSRCQRTEIPEALNNIKTRLENIDIALTNFYNIKSENKQDNKHEETSILKNAHAIRSNADKRRQLIQNSLKTTLEKLHTFPPTTTKNKPVIQVKNSSYFLPHDLKVKRAAARKAYLASLQTKPKVPLKNITKKKAQTPQNKIFVPKNAAKTGEKGVSEKKALIPNEDKEATLVSSIENDTANDQNMEYIVDAILDDLLGETALDFNKIKQNKREKDFLSKQKRILNKKSDSDHLLVTSFLKNEDSKMVPPFENQSIIKLKSFFNYEKPDQSPKLKTSSTSEVIKDTDLPPSNVKCIPEEPNIVKKNSNLFHPNQTCSIEVSPKFICDVSKTITVDDEKAKNIQQNKERYWNYLEIISRTAKGNFNPWVLNSMLAESILDDCINDITEELSIVPSSLIQDLYNEEFLQQVKK